MLTYTYLSIHQSSAMCTNPGYMQESRLSRDAETAVFPTTSISFSERILRFSQASQETLSLHQVLGLLQGHLTKRAARRHSRQIKGASAHRQHRQPFGGASFMPLVSMSSFFQLVPKLCVHRWGQKRMLSSETTALVLYSVFLPQQSGTTSATLQMLHQSVCLSPDPRYPRVTAMLQLDEEMNFQLPAGMLYFCGWEVWPRCCRC